MADSFNTPYAPYGAYELKSTYQRHMAFGMLTAIVMVALATAVPNILSLFTADTVVIGPDVIVPVRDSVIIIIRSDPPPTIIPTPPEIVVRASAEPILSGRPVAVSDSLMSDGPEPVFATQEELSALLGPGAGSSSLPSNMGIVDTFESFPEPDQFVPVEIPPEMIDYVTPEYPRLLREIGLTGVVWVKALVDTNGKVRNAIVAKSSDNDLLDRAAVEAAYKNTFKPGIQNGRAVACWVSYRVEFVK